jgi:hypothetical protein
MGSFMRDSERGPLSKEREFYNTLFDMTQPIPADPMFEEQRLPRFLASLQDRSELRVCIHLHTRLIPSAELLSFLEPQKFDELIEGNNDKWNKAVMFCKRLPQPDLTVAYRESVLTDQQRRKLNILPEVSSFFAGREGTCFPFFTCEVKCGTQALDIADRANTNSMTIVLRGVVELYRRAGRVMDVHRRILGFSISHDDKNVRIYGHYPEIEGEKTSYYRHRIRSFDLADKNGEEKWTTYTFVYNLYAKFAPEHIKRIKEVVDLLPDPLAQPFSPTTVLSDYQGTPNSQQEFAQPELPQGRVTNAALRHQIQQLIEQLIQQRRESGQQRKELMAQLEQQRKESEQHRKESEQQRKESEQQRKELMAQLEQQRKESVQQRKDSEEERKELLQMLKQQNEQFKELMKGR